MKTSSYRALKATVLRRIESGQIVPHGERDAVRRAIADVVAEYQERAHLEDQLTPLSDPQAMVDRLLASVVDLGPLTELLGHDDIEEIQVQGNKIVYWTSDGRVHWLAPTSAEDELRQYIERLLQASAEQAQLDASNPVVSTGIGNGSRLSAKIPPVVDELTVSIRQQVARRPTLRQLVDSGTLTVAAAGLLFALMQTRSRVVVAGPPGAGKTTLVNALLAAVPPDHVVRVNEETRELTAEITLGGYARASDRPGQTLRDLIKADLRFRPDLLVVGEVRGGEAFELLRPLNAGVGLLTTVHANQAGEAVDALAVAAELAGERVSGETIRRLFARHVEFVVFIDADDARVAGEPVRRRQVMEIAWIEPQLRSGHVVHEPLFVREELGLPLEWSGVAPPPEVTRPIEKGLTRRAGEHVPLKSVLAGERIVGGVR
jgi:pilus assembly protein CpaF